MTSKRATQANTAAHLNSRKLNFTSQRVALCALGMVTVNAMASEAEPKTSPKAGEVFFVTNAPNDRDKLLGDRVWHHHDIHVLVADTTKSPMTFEARCVVAGTELKSVGIAKVNLTNATKNGAGSSGSTDSVIEERFAFSVIDDPLSVRQVVTGRSIGRTGSTLQGNTQTIKNRCNPSERANTGDIVLLTREQLFYIPPRRAGIAFGTLFVPYKYQLRGDRSFSGSSTLGGYVGWRESVAGRDMRFIGFVGASNIAVPTTASGQPSTQNIAGLSYGFGVLGTLKDSFQLGLILGADRVGRSTPYVNQGKAWVALSLGFEFSN